MGILAKIGHEVKSLSAEIKSLPFSAYGGTGAGYGGYGGGLLPGYGFSFQGNLPGSQFDDKTAAGVLWENPAAAACFVALTKAFAQARPYLERRKIRNGNDWERVDHEIIERLERPNQFYSGEKLFGVTLICAMSQGAAFWRFERDRRGGIGEIWYEPPVGIGASGIAPNWDAQHFIKDYYHFVDGKRSDEPLAVEDVVYFRHGLNVANPRLPWAPLGLGAREIAVLNAASTYTAAVLRNHGAPAGFVSMDGGGLASSTPPTPEQAESLKAHIEAKFGGPQNAGKTFVSSLPWKWNKVGMTPAELVIDKIRQWPQETVCALLGTPVIVALLPTGTQPTYENLDASMKWWWDNTIIPLEDAFADEIETQMFSSYGLDAAEYRIAWDRSRVPALQEDEAEKHAMWREDYKAGVIDRYTALHKLGEEADESLKGVLHPSATAGDPQSEPVTPEEAAQQARLSAAAESIKFAEEEWIRKSGKFNKYVGSASGGAFEALHEWKGDSVPPESEALQEGKAKAFKKLLPYAEDGKKEAASVILNSDGKEVSFEVGNIDEVKFRVPLARCTILHTHPTDSPFSGKDWYGILSSDNAMQEHVVGPSMTFSLHKPETWKGHDISPEKFNAQRKEILMGIQRQAYREGKTLSNNETDLRYNKIMAKKYGILYRVGTRQKEVER